MNPIQRWTLIDPLESNDPIAGSIPSRIEVSNGVFSTEWVRLTGGRKHDVELLVIDTGGIRVAILPTRGMGLWKCWVNDLEIGWQSPVSGPVHPCWVPIHDPSGIGWLEGFDELLVRCGLESNGAPEFAPNGQLMYPLHGRIANLPANRLIVEADAEEGTLDIVGDVDESRFLVRGLRLQSRYRLRIHSPLIEVIDTVTNTSARSASMQLLYHINIGQPILEAGSKVVTACQRVAPRDSTAAAAVDSWETCEAPRAGFSEQVFFALPHAEPSGWTSVLLHNRPRTIGLAVHFDTRSLPFFSLWKNTAAIEDGYVTGIEPATGFPNCRSFELSKGRVVPLAAGESRTFKLNLEPITSQTRVNELTSIIQSLRSTTCDVFSQPDADWSHV